MKKIDLLHGIHTPKPARGFPPGRIRWIMRNSEFVKAAVRTEEGLRIFVVGDEGDAWVPFPDCEQASKTVAERGPASLVEPGMVTIAVQDFADLAATCANLKRRLSTRITMCEKLAKQVKELEMVRDDHWKLLRIFSDIDAIMCTMRPRYVADATMDGKYPAWSVWLPKEGKTLRKTLKDALIAFVDQSVEMRTDTVNSNA